MKKLLEGIVDFRNKLRPSYRETFAKLALGQSPDALFIGCSDSRVAVNVFASTDPGDLFVVRNVGNLVPPCQKDGHSTADESEAAAIEFALGTLKVGHIIVCGHSECGAMQALTAGRKNVKDQNLRSWLRHGEADIELPENKLEWGAEMSAHNRLSQLNVIRQMNNLRTYPIIQERLKKGELQIHGWWFELRRAEVFGFDQSLNRFVIIDESFAKKIMSDLHLGARGQSRLEV